MPALSHHARAVRPPPSIAWVSIFFDGQDASRRGIDLDLSQTTFVGQNLEVIVPGHVAKILRIIELDLDHLPRYRVRDRRQNVSDGLDLTAIQRLTRPLMIRFDIVTCCRCWHC